MTSYVTPKRDTEFIFYIGLVSQSTGQFQVNPTIAAGDFKVSKDGGAFANLATLPAVTPAGGRAVKVTLSSTEMGADNLVFQGVDAAGSEWDEVIVNIQTSVRQIDDLATPTNITAGTITTATNVTTVNGLAANVITAASMAADASAEIADAVWDEDATGHQTQGTFGQAIGDPVADTNTIFKAVVTDAAGANVGADTTSALSRLPAALSGDGFMKADLKSIEDELTSGNNATLNLKKLNIVNDVGQAVTIFTSDTEDYALFVSGGAGGIIQGTTYQGLIVAGNIAALDVQGTGGAGDHALRLTSSTGGKSLEAPQDINVSDGELTLAAIAGAVWANATRTLTSFGTLVADIWALAIETGYTAKQSMRLMLSALAGKLSGAATTTVVIRSATDAKDRITATVDSSGNRTAVTHDTTD